MPDHPTTEAATEIAQHSLSARPANHGGAGLLDVALTATVIVVALYYLYRKLWRQAGRCDGCAQSGRGQCGIARQSAPRPRARRHE